MGLFTKKVKADRKEKGKPENGAKAPPAKKKNDRMSAVLKESVVETILEDFVANLQFTVQQNGVPVYVGMYLNTEDIGGLSKKSAKDEAKGSIIEAINSGRMTTLITADLLEDECIVFVPNPVTLDAMEEYELLTDAPYKLALVDRDGAITVTDKSVTYQQVLDLSAVNGDVNELLGDAIAQDSGPADFLPDDSDDMSQFGFSEPEPDAGGFSDVPDYGATDSFSSFDGDADDDLFGGDSAVDSYDPSVPPVSYEDDIPTEPDDYHDDGDIIDIPDDMVKGAVTRRFYSTELGLEVSTDAFDQHFMQQEPFVPFEVQRGEGWLSDYVSKMSQDANTELQRSHRDNLMRVREHFLLLVQAHCEQIVRDLDITNVATQYGQLYQSLQDSKDELEDEAAQKVSDEQARLRREWTEKLELIGQQASASAIQEYTDRYGRQHEDDLSRIPTVVRERLESDIDDQIRELHDMRREEAAKRLDFGVNEALAQVSAEYLTLLENEENQYKSMRADILKFIDDNRKSEIARSETLALELQQSEKADKVTAEYTERIKQMTAEADANAQRLAGEIDILRAKHEADLSSREQEYKRQVEALQQNNEALNGQIRSLMDQISAMGATKDEEYKGRMHALEMERDTALEKFDHAVNNQHRSTMITGMLVAVALFAAIAIGFIAGEYMDIHRASNSAQTAIINEFNQRMDEMQIQAMYPEIYEAWLDSLKDSDAGGAGTSGR